MAERYGRQTPTNSVTLPYTMTRGPEAIELYEKTGRRAQDWQKLLVYDILSCGYDGSPDLWIHTKFGYAVPRRNGKNEVVSIRELWGLTHGEAILHTAHRTPTSSSAFSRLYELLGKAGYAEKKDFSVYRQYGLERIEMSQEIGGGYASFRTRTAKGGLGEGFDLLVIDEAQEYATDQESALKYVVTSSQNPQTIFCGTPPTPVSSGTVFAHMREKVLSSGLKNTGWAEWSVEKMTDPNDVDAWYETNPSLGTIITERSIQDEIGDDDLDFNIQRLGYWTKVNLKSAISEAQWAELKAKKLPKLKGKLSVGIKYGADGQNTSLSIAVKTASGKVFVEAIDCQPQRNGDGWILRFLKAADLQNVVVDGAGGQKILIDEMKDAKLKAPVCPKVGEVIEAYALFQQAMDAGEIVHMGQPSLAQSVTNVQRRAIGSNGGFGFKSIKESSDISLMESMVFAFWSCKKTKERRKQKVFY